MRLDDLPRTTVVDGRRRRRRRAGTPPTEVEALRELLGQAQDVYREALGTILQMVNVSSDTRPALAQMREIGREFLRRADARQWRA